VTKDEIQDVIGVAHTQETRTAGLEAERDGKMFDLYVQVGKRTQFLSLFSNILTEGVREVVIEVEVVIVM